MDADLRRVFGARSKMVLVMTLAFMGGCRKLTERPTALAASSHPLAADHALLTFNSSHEEELSVCLNGPLRIHTALKTIQAREENTVFAALANTEVCDVRVQALRLDQRKNLIGDDMFSLKKRESKTISWELHDGDYIEFSLLERINCVDKNYGKNSSSEILQFSEQTKLQLGDCG